MADLQPYLPYIGIALNGLIAGWLAGLLLGVTAYTEMVPYGTQVLISTIGAVLVILIARIVGR